MPEGVQTDYICVTTAGGTVLSPYYFVVLPPTTLDVSVNVGSEYVGKLSGVALLYRLNGPDSYTGSLVLDDSGKTTISNLQLGSYSMSIFGSHWLSQTLTDVVVDGTVHVNVDLANGDADGDNSVNLFDFVVLDSKFGSSSVTADIDGDGSVNLFDYVIIDRYFGAQGDALLPPVSKVNPKDDAEMVWVPAGAFIMGSVDSGDESPQRSVYMDGYWIYKYEVTVAQYRQFCLATSRSMPTEPSFGWQDTHPIVNVKWQDAQDYATWAEATLPTEAQWEKAARGIDGRVYSWGNVWDASKCANNFNTPKGTKPVGSYPTGVSPYGCMDMSGNAWELCVDWYSSSYYQVAPNRNPLGPLDGDTRVSRGGAWNNAFPLSQNSCANRNSTIPGNTDPGCGFRCAKAP